MNDHSFFLPTASNVTFLHFTCIGLLRAGNHTQHVSYPSEQYEEPGYYTTAEMLAYHMFISVLSFGGGSGI